MKVGLLVPGGVDRTGEHRVVPCLLWLIERLAKAHELHVFAMWQEPRPSRYELLGADVHVIGARPHRLRMAGAIVSEHRRHPFDVLHAFWAVPPGVVGAVVGKLLGVPVVLHLTGGDLAALPEIEYGGLQNRRGRWLLRLAVGGASRITTPSFEMQRRARGLGIEAERLPLGVALDRWPPRLPRRRDASQPAKLIHVASLNRVKDQVTLIRAVRKLKEDGCQFHLDVVGADTLGGRIQAMCRDHAVAERVTFHGFLPHRALRPLMEQAHILIVSSRHEADPIVLLEAAVVGVPAVSTLVGHAGDWAPVAARAVPVGDAGALSGEILDLLASEEARVEVAVAAQQRATSEDADWCAGRVLAIYEDVASGNYT